MKKFVVVEAVVVVPGVTLEAGTTLVPSTGGKYYAPGTLVDIPHEFLYDETKFQAVKKFEMSCLDSFMKGVEANLEKELDVGEKMITINLDTLAFDEETFVGTTTQLATLASGFSIPLPANAKQKYNRLNKLNDVFGLNLDMEAVKLSLGIESPETQKLNKLVAAINEAM